jgi:hypothetical protein
MENFVATIDQNAARLNSHEAVCELRYESICARLKRIEQIILCSAGFMIISLASIAFKLH